MLFYLVFFFKQKTAYEMRISDWSSDVCSSDLGLVGAIQIGTGNRDRAIVADVDLSAGFLGQGTDGRPALADHVADLFRVDLDLQHARCEIGEQIGRASCRERVCQYV